MGVGISILRWLYFCCSLLIWICGLGLMGVGLWLRFDQSVIGQISMSSGDEPMKEFYIFCYVIIGVGLIMALFGFLACCGALMQNGCMLLLFFTFVMIVIMLEIASAVLLYIYKNETRTYIENSMEDVIHHRYLDESTNPAIFKWINHVQSQYKCCGVRSYLDWLPSRYANSILTQGAMADLPIEVDGGNGGNTKFSYRYERQSQADSDQVRVPPSCCKEMGIHSHGNKCGIFTRFTSSAYSDFLHSDGCVDAMLKEVMKYKIVIICAFIALFAIEVLSLALTMLLFCYIRRDKY